VFKCVHGSAPPYLTDELSCPADSLARCRLHSASSSILVVRRTRLTTVGDDYFRSLHHVYGTIFHSTSSRNLPFESLNIVWRLICFLPLFLNLYILFVKCLRGDFCHFWHFNRYLYIYILHLSYSNLHCSLHDSYSNLQCLLHVSYSNLHCSLHVSYSNLHCLLHVSYSNL